MNQNDYESPLWSHEVMSQKQGTVESQNINEEQGNELEDVAEQDTQNDEAEADTFC